jgi:hypothetical protein
VFHKNLLRYLERTFCISPITVVSNARRTKQNIGYVLVRSRAEQSNEHKKHQNRKFLKQVKMKVGNKVPNIKKIKVETFRKQVKEKFVNRVTNIKNIEVEKF